MFESSVGEVAAGDVAGLAAALLGLSAREVLGGDLASAQAVVAAASPARSPAATSPTPDSNIRTILAAGEPLAEDHPQAQSALLP